MKFTGERYIPSEGGDIRQEHLHRYAWCRHLAAGKQILDIACGEGYGSAMLAAVARSVVGVDISGEAVEHATQTYANVPRLEFRVGDAAEIPLADASVDMVVSFETIEHHARHAEMLSEIRRVLRPDGLLVISSPNRDIYSERAGYHNEFHVKELDFAEFDETLRKQFGNIRYFGQRLAVGSCVYPLDDAQARDRPFMELADSGKEVIERAAVLQDPVYFIAVAGAFEAVLPDTLRPSALFSEVDDLYTHHIEVAAWARRQGKELAELHDRYAQSVRDASEVSAWARRQGKELAELHDRYAQSVRDASEVSAWAHAQASAASDAQRSAEILREQLAERANELEHVRADARRHVRQIEDQAAQLRLAEAEQANLSLKIDSLQGELLAMRGEVVKNHARLRVLEQQRAELELIKASRSWRWTRPWRFLMRTLRGHGISQLDRQQLQRRFSWRTPPPATGPHVLAEPLAENLEQKPPASGVSVDMAAERGEQSAEAKRIAPAPQLPDCRDYFVWAVIDWHFRTQRPQHLARELAAAGHRVFYISNNFMDAPEAGFAIESLDTEGKLFQVHLNLQGAPQIYHAAPDARQREQLRASTGELLAWTRTRGGISLVQHPYWLETARMLPDTRLAYDCMDHHGGFSDNDADVLAREGELMQTADLLVVTSDWLYAETGKHNPHRLMVRNACQYDHFAHRCANPFKDARGRKVIGYYGAIAEWFDLDLVEKVARRFSDCLVLLVGNDTIGARERLSTWPNVELTGEVPYAALPTYLDGFDVCMLPFQVIPLTLATNPVKVYEYLSAGKEVVSVALPEMRQFGDLVRTADTHEEFIEAVANALRHGNDATLAGRRQRFAAEQTWTHRALALSEGLDALRAPKVSVIVLTYNNLDLTKTCLASVEHLSHYENLEVIVVDNASSDGTQDFLREWGQGGGNRKVILNAENLGFAAGNNVGLAAADGEYLVLLNNDTHVTPGWVATLVGHLRRDRGLGMIGPVTNNIGNEARIDLRYDDMNAMLEAAAAYTARHVGQSMPMRTAAFFCVMMRRVVYEKVGPLDEAFGVGFFEDDDYCRRVEQAGWSIACAEDVFVHHHLSASFNKLKQERRQALFEKNKAVYEAKWGPWEPHKYRAG